MARNWGSSLNGLAFVSDKVSEVWAKATIVSGYDPNVYRKDRCGAWICFSEYGKTTAWGWEIDHAFPVARGGTDDLSNLHPLQWQNNRGKADNFPNWSCTVKA